MSDDKPPFMPTREQWERACYSLEAIDKLLSGAGFPQTLPSDRVEQRAARLSVEYMVALARLSGQITAQRIVFAHVNQRSAKSESPATFAARQLVRLIQCVADLAAYINLPTNTDSGLGMYLNLQEAGAKAARLLSDPGQEQWQGSVIYPLAAARLVDVQVALYCIAEILGVSADHAIKTAADNHNGGA